MTLARHRSESSTERRSFRTTREDGDAGLHQELPVAIEEAASVRRPFRFLAHQPKPSLQMFSGG